VALAELYPKITMRLLAWKAEVIDPVTRPTQKRSDIAR
jgi:hypothetical protein